MSFDVDKLKWTRFPRDYSITHDKIEIVTEPKTDLWQRTYYHFRNDNAPVLQTETDEKYFSFSVKTEYQSSHRFDQCGIVMYLDSENWLKASVEYENERFGHLGSVVTNNGYSDRDIAESIFFVRLERCHQTPSNVGKRQKDVRLRHVEMQSELSLERKKRRKKIYYRHQLRRKGRSLGCLW
ncbi:MAG: DUF1349 domain-containing protein [Clostridia bacterium]|nr:DUF1349 domain-containing protein [Clostridia bacterium]